MTVLFVSRHPVFLPMMGGVRIDFFYCIDNRLLLPGIPAFKVPEGNQPVA